jgi:hypothetical protein
VTAAGIPKFREHGTAGSLESLTQAWLKPEHSTDKIRRILVFVKISVEKKADYSTI